MPSARSLAPYTTSCGKIFLTHKTPFHILPITKSKFLSIIPEIRKSPRILLPITGNMNTTRQAAARDPSAIDIVLKVLL